MTEFSLGVEVLVSKPQLERWSVQRERLGWALVGAWVKDTIDPF